MAHVRVGLLVLTAVTALAAGCGTQPSTSAPADNQAAPPAAPPTAAVGVDGKPISSLCDLLAESDFADITGKSAQKPTPAQATATSATCDYGDNMKLTVQIGDTVDSATQSYRTALKTDGYTVVKQGPIGGVDESAYGTSASSAVLNVRRLKLVVSIAIPGTDGEIKLVQLAARVLSRANALGT